MTKEELAALMGQLKGVGEGLSAATSLLEKQGGDLAGLTNRLGVLEQAVQHRGVSLPGAENTAKKVFSLTKAIKFIASKNQGDSDLQKECAYEIDVMKEARKTAEKTMSTLVDSSGGYLVPEQAIPEIVPLLRAASVLTKAGVTRLDGLTGAPVPFRRQTGGATVYWRGEGQAGTKSELTFGKSELSPKHVIAVVPITKELLRMGNPSVDGLVQRDLVNALNLETETQFVLGSGSSSKPLGIVNTNGIGSVSVAGTVSVEKLWDLAATVKALNVAVTKGGYLMHTNLISRIKKLRTDGGGGAGTGPFLFKSVKDIEDMLGFPIFEANYLRTNLGGGSTYTETLFAEFPEILIATWGGLVLEASDQASDAAGNSAFMQNEVWLKVTQMVDVGVREPKAIAYCGDITGNTI